MKMLSVMLYSDEAVIAMIAGTEYCVSNFRIFPLPNDI
jgi:hypothetical protein